MDIKPAPTTELEQYLDWTNYLTARLVSSVGKKIEVTEVSDKPEIGELLINWYQEAFDEQCGEFVTVERWNGDGWEQHGLDVHMTVEDLDNLNRELGGEL
jgi:hypothetical protein